MRRTIAKIYSFILLLTVFFSSYTVAAEVPRYNMTKGVTPISRDIYGLHMTIFYICCAIAVVVFGVLIYTLIMHRKSRGATPAQFHGNTAIEITWAVIPFIILVLMAIPATKVLMKMDDTGKADIVIKVTGYQWKWSYDYLNEGISFFSNLATPQEQIQNKAAKSQWYMLDVDNPVVVPIHKKIRFLVTSNDVIHSWWVPALGIKKDAIPGFITDRWAWVDEPGTYRGQCAELCGVNHGYMPIVVKAVPQAEYDAWVLAQTESKRQALVQASADTNKEWSKAELMALGEEVYGNVCAVCHKSEGVGMPPAFPALKGQGISVGPAYNHVDIVLNGKQGSAMQAFRSQLSDAEIAAVITYERNAWGNDDIVKKNGQQNIVQPAQVKEQREENKA
jgi:cytochrome c oxidase subunit 2